MNKSKLKAMIKVLENAANEAQMQAMKISDDPLRQLSFEYGYLKGVINVVIDELKVELEEEKEVSKR
jgi:hypothetical protein